MRVLILDDSLTVRMDLLEAFDGAGWSSSPCETVAEARKLLSQEAFDVIVLDVVLPDGDGVDVLAEVRASPLNSGAVVLMLSGEAEVKDRVRGLRTGADAYVAKPYEIGYVLARARELVTARAPAGVETGAAPILVIDDSPTVCAQLVEVLEREGYRVEVAHTGEEGLRLAAARRPQAMLVDGVLPDIDGATVIRRMRLDAALRSVPCLMLTGSQQRNAELLALDAGADAFVRKEQDLTVAVAKLSALLRRGQADSGVEEPSSLLAPKKILIVSDGHAPFSKLLRGEGFEVVTARSGDEALELIGIEAVDCILVEEALPGPVDGHETCRRVKAVPSVRDVPMIMLAGAVGRTEREDRQALVEALAAGADDYLVASEEFGVVAARIRAQLRRRQVEDESRRIREELLYREIEAAEARADARIAQSRAAMVEELERKNRELEAFSYSVSHDLRAPLRSVDGFTHILLESVAEHLDDDGRHYADRVRAGVARMSEMIDDMLQLSRVGRAQLERQDVDLATVADSVLAELAEREPSRSVAVTVARPLPVSADPRLLRHVLENLLGNAWKFTSRRSDARIEVGAEDLPEGRAYFVRDNGGGFDMNHAEKLFVPFQRLHSESEYPGTGVGLATVNRVIERHGGRIWADSVLGEGATFRFTLPTP
ncbi:response regulator [Spongisporangium articulatum]|uniref:Sensor-like histidine kinase SenX3 n=1 Tax=Spongisporangium articulatum TaxID=3362603 RepID=A0ABW8AKI4_9ACTN